MCIADLGRPARTCCGPVKSSCVKCGKMTKPTLKSGMLDSIVLKVGEAAIMRANAPEPTPNYPHEPQRLWSHTPIYNTRAFPSGESIRDGRNPIAGSAEFHMLLDVNEFLCDARRRSAADTFRSDAIEQASLHIVSGVEIA
jgi:hypothetical protein